MDDRDFGNPVVCFLCAVHILALGEVVGLQVMVVRFVDPSILVDVRDVANWLCDLEIIVFVFLVLSSFDVAIVVTCRCSTGTGSCSTTPLFLAA